ncbi:MAG: pantoate--beta-alanine ligase [Bacteroidia bacterium]|nr:pantoate--beta-alanine ligase [Bacteroidia bacterium]
MKLYQGIHSLQNYLKGKRAQNLQIGFVPTMGALHNGHLSLVKFAHQKCDVVVCSIFVNPTQFNNEKDLEFYPRPIKNDIKLLVEAGCHVLFHPQTSEMYGSGLHKDSSANYGSFIEVLEGAHRPGHFDGVITIVKRLFEIVEPNEVFFGQKDYQQCLVVKKLIARNFRNISFNQCVIEREPDGLAMSSRNVRLNIAEREAANTLYTALMHIKNNWTRQNWLNAISKARAIIENNPLLNLAYLSVAHPATLQQLNAFEEKAVALIAVNCGEIRLIDNVLLG